jgi:hypothetical protein
MRMYRVMQVIACSRWSVSHRAGNAKAREGRFDWLESSTIAAAVDDSAAVDLRKHSQRNSSNCRVLLALHTT